MRGRVLAVAVTLVASGRATAEAALLESPADQFRLHFAPAGAEICVVFPTYAASQCDGLEGVQVPSVRGLQDSMFVRGAGGGYNLSHILTNPYPSGEAGRKEMTKILLQALRASEPVVAPGPTLKQQRFGTVDVTRVDFGVQLGGGADHEATELAMTLYILLGARAGHALLVAADPAVIVRARADVEAALPRVRFDPAAPEEGVLERVVYPVGVLALGGLLIFGVILLMVRRVALKERLEEGDIGAATSATATDDQ